MAQTILDEVQPEKPKQPLGDFDTRCDDKGRVRLPSDWLHFFEHGLNDKKVFTTSLDGSVIRIYPESIWRANLSLFEELSDQSDDVERILTLANHYGTESDIDSSGRVLIKSNLRTELALLGDVVVGSGKKNVIHLQKKADHEAIIFGLKAGAPVSVKNLTRAGMR